jgi:hypothetical protein
MPATPKHKAKPIRHVLFEMRVFMHFLFVTVFIPVAFSVRTAILYTEEKGGGVI